MYEFILGALIGTLSVLINGHARLFILHKNSTLPALIRACPFIKSLKLFHPARLLGLPTFWSPPCPFIYFSIFFQIFLNFSKLFQNFPEFSEFFWIFPNYSEFFQIFPDFFWMENFWALERKKISPPAHLLCTFSAYLFI